MQSETRQRYPPSRFIKVRQSNYSTVYLFTKSEVLSRFEKGFLRDCALYGESHNGASNWLPETISLQNDTFVVLCQPDEPDYLFYLHKYCEGSIWKQFVDKKEMLRLYVFYNMMGCGEMLPGLSGAVQEKNSSICNIQ